MTAPDQTNAEVSDERLRELNDALMRTDAFSYIVTSELRSVITELLTRRSVTSQASEGMAVAWTGPKQLAYLAANPMSTVVVWGAQRGEESSIALYAAPVSKRVERLEAALKPFADAAADLPEHIHDMVPVVLTTDAEDNPADIVHIGDFRRALQALGDRS